MKLTKKPGFFRVKVQVFYDYKKIVTFIENLNFSEFEISEFNAMRPEIENLHRHHGNWNSCISRLSSKLMQCCQ